MQVAVNAQLRLQATVRLSAGDEGAGRQRSELYWGGGEWGSFARPGVLGVRLDILGRQLHRLVYFEKVVDLVLGTTAHRKWCRQMADIRA